MSEVKGTLLTIILALLTFTAISLTLVNAVSTKATTVSDQIKSLDTGYAAPAAGGAGAAAAE